ncbi:aldose 1-epimerase family protein [Okibacterium endophyticum]
MTQATGEQFDLVLETSTGRIAATVTEVGAGIRRLAIDGVDLVPPYDATTQRPFASGIVFVPWPNRVRDGRWTLDGEPQQLDITEVDKNNAIHGLLRFTSFRPSERTESKVLLGARVNPQHGYPFALETSVCYELVDAGLEITHRVTNMSDAPAPVAIGAHPFFTIGDVEPQDLTVTLNCTTHFSVDERLLPAGEHTVDDTEFDLRGGRVLSELSLDDGFGGAVMRDGISEHHLAAADGRTLTIWGDDNFPYWQVFTTERYPGQAKAVAIEPMSAPADAFNSGRDLHWLAPNETWQASWGVRADGFARV